MTFRLTTVADHPLQNFSNKTIGIDSILSRVAQYIILERNLCIPPLPVLLYTFDTKKPHNRMINAMPQ